MGKQVDTRACGSFARRQRLRAEAAERDRHVFETITAAALMRQHPADFPDRSSALREARRLYDGRKVRSIIKGGSQA